MNRNGVGVSLDGVKDNNTWIGDQGNGKEIEKKGEWKRYLNGKCELRPEISVEA